MSDDEALWLLDQLRAAIKDRHYALYYVGMMGDEENVLIALDRAMAALASQTLPVESADDSVWRERA